MGNFGDLLPEDKKREYIDRHLKPGQVLYLECGFTKPRKSKFLVLVHMGKRPLFFVINSNIHPYIRSRPHLLACQVVLKASDYDFLKWDSVLDCSDVIHYFGETVVRDQILEEMNRVKGELTTSTKQEIIGVVQGARTISQRYKRWIVESLE